MDPEHVLACQFARWYTGFQHVTFRSRVIDLPDQFIDYLLQDGVHLPATSPALPKRSRQDLDSDADGYRDWSDNEVDHIEPAEEAKLLPSFPDLTQQIDKAISDLGGRCIPKLNWSCPLDATWINSSGSLLCTSSDEVVILLKSSDRVLHDVSDAFDGCVSHPSTPPRLQLALRRYVDMRPEREFRCFVLNHVLIAISQRHITDFFPSIIQQRQSLLSTIREFHATHICGRFDLASYTCDVYINSRGNVRLVDFNPVGGTTSPLLFTWDELPFHKGSQPSTTEPGQPQGTSHSSPMSTTIAHDPFASLAQYPLDTPPPGQEVETEMDRLVSAGWSHSSGDGCMVEAYEQLSAEVNRMHSSEAYAEAAPALFDGAAGAISPAPSSQLTHQTSRTLSMATDHASRRGSGGSLPQPMRFQLPTMSTPEPVHKSVCGWSSESDVDISETLRPDPDERDFAVPAAGSWQVPGGPTQQAQAEQGSTFSEDEASSEGAQEQDAGTDGQQGHEEVAASEGVFRWCHNGVEFRCVLAPNSVRQNPPRGGVPYDMIDPASGGNIDALLEKLQMAGFGEGG